MNRSNTKTSSPMKHQTGVALVTVMVILILMTIIGVSALQTTRLEQLMAGNTQATHSAFQIAESGLVGAAKGTAWSSNKGSPNTASGTLTTGAVATSKQFVGQYKLPRGSGYDAGFKRNQYTVDSTGEAKSGSDTIATKELLEGVYRIVPSA